MSDLIKQLLQSFVFRNGDSASLLHGKILKCRFLFYLWFLGRANTSVALSQLNHEDRRGSLTSSKVRRCKA